MYYLKYRPRSVEEIDNLKAKEVLKRLLSSGTIPHAFLFVGTKGTGKTSSARIVAKAINCLKNKFADKKNDSFEPCGTCTNCRSIDSSTSADVVEMDAASNRGIEEVRSLIRDTAYLPMHNRYKVFIIDEAHMITPEAFNALLKTLEEPPPSTVFILATTNVEKVPATIVSRTHVVNFGRAKKDEVISMLKRIAKSESLTVDPGVLTLIAARSDHSFRDGAKLLEELVIQKRLTLDKAQEFIGLFGTHTLLEIVDKKPLKDALHWVEEFNTIGGDYKALIEDLLEELRLHLLKKSGVEGVESDLDIKFSIVEVSRLMKLLTQAHNQLKITPIESLPLEIAIADFYNERKKS